GLLQHVCPVERSLQAVCQRLKRCGIEAVGKHLGTGDMTFLDVKVQLDAAPGETLIKQMAEGGRLAEVPLPAALAGKRLRKAGQIRERVGGDDFCLHTLAVVGEK